MSPKPKWSSPQHVSPFERPVKINTGHVEAVKTSSAAEQIVEKQTYNDTTSTTPACVDILFLYFNSVILIPFYNKLHPSCRNILQTDKHQMRKQW